VDNLLNHAALGWARDNGFRHYDFGTSSIDMRENEGLIRFKAGFGGGSHFRDTYVWDAA
jgi:lipid II:glycine glycyltransferase (peptidoglycan interpeptide bridge formation enzyme)